MSEITIEASLKFYEAGNKIAVKHLKMSSYCWCNFTIALTTKGLFVFSLPCDICCRTLFSPRFAIEKYSVRAESSPWVMFKSSAENEI